MVPTDGLGLLQEPFGLDIIFQQYLIFSPLSNCSINITESEEMYGRNINMVNLQCIIVLHI